MISVASLSEQFDELGFVPGPAVLGKCVDLCTTYNITDPVDFVEQWMAFSASHLNSDEPTLDNLNDLERKELAPKLKRDKQHGVSVAGTTTTNNNSSLRSPFPSGQQHSPSTKQPFGHASSSIGHDASDELMDSYIGRTPTANKARSRIQHSTSAALSPLSASSTLTYTSGQVVYTFGNAQLVQNTSWASSGLQKLTIHHVSPSSAAAVSPPPEARPSEVMQPNEKYMFDTLSEKALLCGDHLFDIGHQICQKIQSTHDANRSANTDTSQLADEEVVTIFDSLVYPDTASQQVITCVGRICADTEAKINPNATLLVSTEDSKMRSVRLNFSNINSVALFAGQIVAVRGINARGDMLFVQEIYSERELARSPKPTGLAEALSLLVVAGPYTQTDDLTYEPLHDVLASCKDNRPDVLVMVGPFVDANHGMIEDELPDSFDVFFEKMVALIMESVGCDTQVIMVSSSQDVNSTSVYPTHPMQIKAAYPNLRFISDPSLISVNGVTIGVTATDVVAHLNAVEMTHNAGERIKRAVNHLFHQASFYPLNPPHEDVSVDSELASKFCALKTVPNVLLLPGEAKCFIRDINGCLVLNPGRLTDKKSRGTFARLVITPPNRDETNLSNYVACQVIKV